jgi:Spy/CpxP family protein refolding chaperone
MIRRDVIRRAIAIGVGLAALVVAWVPAGLLAQGTPGGGPYAGQQASAVPGLSEAEIAALRGGEGAGLARAGEVNGYPGPRHVLDLADALALTAEQRAAVQALFGQTQAEAVAAGEQVLREHASLGQAFREGPITLEALQERTAALGQSEGRLRAVHLKYHLLTRPLLTDEQVAAYARLRGYAADSAPVQHTPGMQHVPGMQH